MRRLFVILIAGFVTVLCAMSFAFSQETTPPVQQGETASNPELINTEGQKTAATSEALRLSDLWWLFGS